ncbi:hypothetical protein HOY82DRAFT_544328 [Tuber indicum]|nr:hypothetical protein HOY82DRAFT_544328 [Tuber indicum]
MSCKHEIIEISSDSDSDTSPLCSNEEEILRHLIQEFSNSFACSEHLPLSSSNTVPPSWSLARISQWIDQSLPMAFPEPGKLGYWGRVSSQQWQRLPCGILDTNSIPSQLEIPAASFSSKTTTRYDIDSIIAKAKCFSVIDKKLLSGKYSIHQVPLHHIPHFYLGHLASRLHLPLYVFLPTLWNNNVKNSSYISNQHLQQCLDMGFIPTILRHFTADIIQYLPLSFNTASMNVFARGRELGVQGGRFESGKRLEFHYFLSGRYLQKVWQDMVKFSEQPGCTHFQGMFLLVDAKDLKLQLKSSTMAGYWHLLEDMVEGELDFTVLDKNFQFLDLGQEVSSEDENQTCFFRTCCLEKGLKQIREKSTGLKAATYSWALTTATANQTLAYSKCSSQYENGLVYSQYYAPLKSFFDAGDRVLRALKAAIQQRRSFGIRQEHGISFQLFDSLKLRAEQIDFSGFSKCCFMQESSEIFHFLHGNFLRFDLGLEYTAARLKMINFDQSQDLSRIFRMFLQMQKCCFSNILLEAQGDLWRSQTGTGEKYTPGLALKDQLATYKFCWLSKSILDWRNWAFGNILSKSTTFNYIQFHPTSLRKAKHWLYEKTQSEFLERFGELLKAIHDSASHDTYKILAFLGTQVIQTFRTDVWKALFKFCNSEWTQDAELRVDLALSGQLPLDCENILGFAPSRFSRIKLSNRYKFFLQERWEILFHVYDK